MQDSPVALTGLDCHSDGIRWIKTGPRDLLGRVRPSVTQKAGAAPVCGRQDISTLGDF